AGTAWEDPYFENAKFVYNESKDVNTAVKGAYAGDPTRYWPNVKTLKFAGYSDACGVAKNAEMDFADNELTIPTYTQDNATLGGNFKLGYGFRLHRRIRTTLQVGTQYILLMESIENSYNGNYYSDMKIANGAYTMGLTFGARLNFVLASWLGLSITPEYILSVYKSPGFEVLSGHSEKIRNYSEGFNCNVGLNIFF
ncbi:MAG: hypothetical protein IKW05_00340, partial [Muribaculaceae bacterium]|nr:hypothetical protein [Muribaculaceae bacterium]